MSRIAFPVLTLATFAALAVAPYRATAQCRLCSAPTTERGDLSGTNAVKLEIQTRLDFDRLVLLGTGDGSATLRPDGSRSVNGTVAALGGRAMVGTVAIRGEAGRTVRVELPRRIELHSMSGARIAIEDIVSDLPAMPKLDPSGGLVFRFGGQLRISGDAEGDYSGDVPITVEYL
jgi:hypothetical protein